MKRDCRAYSLITLIKSGHVGSRAYYRGRSRASKRTLSVMIRPSLRARQLYLVPASSHAYSSTCRPVYIFRPLQSCRLPLCSVLLVPSQSTFLAWRCPAPPRKQALTRSQTRPPSRLPRQHRLRPLPPRAVTRAAHSPTHCPSLFRHHTSNPSSLSAQAHTR